jgi:hypothetical protein
MINNSIHIIEGIQDNIINKTVLHRAKTIYGLKEKFIQYKVRKRNGKS